MGLCEEPLDAWIRTPANSWSNLFFIFVGIFLLIVNKQQLKRMSLLKIIPLGSIAAGLGSFIYHASYTFFFLTFDLIGMWVLLAFVIGINVKRLFNLSKKWFWSIYFFFLIVPIVPSIIFRGKFGPFMFVVFGILALLLEIPIFRKKKDIKSYRPLFLMLLCQFIAAFFWILDQQGIICDPQNHFFQGHILWHGFNALGIYFLFEHYKMYFQLRIGK